MFYKPHSSFLFDLPNIWGLCIIFILNICVQFNNMSNWCYFAFLIEMLHTILNN